MYVILQTPHFDERAVQPYLDRLVLTLDARVVNAPSEAQVGQPGHETIYSGSNDQLQNPPVIISSPGKDDERGLLVLWKFPVVLARPGRLRLQSPSVVFSLAANLKTAEQLKAKIRQSEYLASQMPSGINLLESFNSDPVLGSVKPRLSALRVSHVKPASPGERDSLRPLKITPPRSLRILPAFQIRARYARPDSTPNSTSLIASLDIEVTPWAGTSLTLSFVDFNLPDATAEDLNDELGFSFPMHCLPKDDLTLLYRLSRSPLERSSSPHKSLTIHITATVLVSAACHPQISMTWSSTVDFTPPLSPGFSTPPTAIQRDHRPAQLSISSNHDPLNGATPLAASRPDDALPSIEFTTKHQRSPSVPDFGVTMTFAAPATTIRPGDMFAWTVFVVNRSKHPRKLALLPIARRKPSSAQGRAPTNRPLSTSYNRRSRDGVRVDVADAVLDDNVLHASQKSAAMDAVDVVCYSTDVRVGPLAPSACQTTELRFMALGTGILGLEAVRVVDLGTQEHVDIKDLPSIVVAEA